MKLRNRFALVIFGILIFFVATPILVLYARGFQFDWQTHQFVKTGALVVKTDPTKALVYLNDVLQDSATPLNIRFLSSGDYNLRVEKEGYLPWTKRLNVKSQLVTWANENREALTLFFAAPKLEQTWNGTSLSSAGQNSKIDFLDGTQVKELDTNSGSISNLVVMPTPLAPATPEEIRTTLATLGIDLPTFTTGKIIRSSNQIYLVLDNTLYLANDKLEKIYSPVTTAYWDSAAAELFYNNNNEIYIYNPNTKTSTLVLRSQTQIKSAVLNIATGYAFFQNENKIKAIELDSRDHQNIYTLAVATDNFMISADGKKLYTLTSTGINEYALR